ncbi:response regulator transcription factor [Actinomadura barringtoniae]|uniref:response regulator transcription factor n=1 Tax=Actinomadura barringtoniae TaxID=1427535 RepID=UPI001FB76605|nr:helix-turn-helix transcriptional regulator [Actinomadura barringtoniae]
MAQAQRERRRLGVRVPGSRLSATDRAGAPFGLSGRETEVAQLVADGFTNQQIAESLFLSVRTIETHLSRIFAKLGATSRVGVGATLRDRSE